MHHTPPTFPVEAEVLVATAGTGELCTECGQNIAGQRFVNVFSRRICVACHQEMIQARFEPPPNQPWLSRVWQRIRGKL